MRNSSRREREWAWQRVGILRRVLLVGVVLLIGAVLALLIGGPIVAALSK